MLTYLHLLGVVLSLGGAVAFLFVFYPALKFLDDPAARMKLLGNSLRYYHPLFLFGICLSFMTGAFRLTGLKVQLAGGYYDRLGTLLLWKFGLTLAIFLVAGMQCFGQGLKLTRMANGVIEGDLARQEYYARKIWRSQLVNLVLLAVTIWVGLKIRGVV